MKRKKIFRIVKRGWLAGIACFILAFLAAGGVWADDEGRTYPIMRPDRETLHRWIESYNAAPLAHIELERLRIPSPRGLLSLLDHLDYIPAERNQGSCGNCWAWAGTGCLGIALDVEEGILDRLSVQYINSCEWEIIGKTCCEGGWLEDFADFYDITKKAIPWSNTNAPWQDGDGSCDTPCESIATTPNYPITSIDDESIPTHELGQEAAIANIKNVLGQDKAVWFAFLLPTDPDWAVFFNFWYNNAEADVWNPDYSCGHTWVYGEGGGHAVLCVGYNDEDPANSYWIMLNSWGTTPSRPKGLFRVDMDMDYDCYYNDLLREDYSFYWQSLDVDFARPSLTAVAEIDPTTVIVGLNNQTLTYYIYATMDVTSSGVDMVGISVPGPYSDVSVTSVKDDGSSVSYTDNTSGNDISVTLTSKITETSVIAVEFEVTTPSSPSTDAFSSASVYDTSSLNPVSCTQGNGDNSAYGADDDSWTVTAKLPAPSELSASAASSSQIDLSWRDNSDGETGFRIEQKTTAQGTYSEIAIVGADVTTYENTGLSASTTYYYRVRAYKNGSYSDYSNEANATTSSSSGGGGGGGGICFIATAAYGTPMASEVKVLCDFRDQYLLTNRAGQALIRFYSMYSPKVAEFVRDKEPLRALIRASLKPLVHFCRALTE